MSIWKNVFIGDFMFCIIRYNLGKWLERRWFGCNMKFLFKFWCGLYFGCKMILCFMDIRGYCFSKLWYIWNLVIDINFLND